MPGSQACIVKIDLIIVNRFLTDSTKCGTIARNSARLGHIEGFLPTMRQTIGISNAIIISLVLVELLIIQERAAVGG